VSAAVLTGLLRDSLRFPGLVVTDALMMGAIVAKYGAGEATVRAFLAGSDLLLIPADADSAVAAMTAAVAAGRITPQRLAQSVRRVLENQTSARPARAPHRPARLHPARGRQQAVPGRGQ